MNLPRDGARHETRTHVLSVSTQVFQSNDSVDRDVRFDSTDVHHSRFPPRSFFFGSADGVSITLNTEMENISMMLSSDGDLNWNSSEYESIVNATRTPGNDVGDDLGLPIGPKIILIFVSVVMMLIGTVGNLVIVIIVFRRPAMRSAINMLLATMAFSHVLLSSVCLFFAMVTIATTDWIFGDSLCNIHAVLHTTLVIEAVSILVIISVDRYLIIVHRKEILSPVRTNIVIVLTWLLSLFIGILPVLGIGDYTHRPGQLQCFLATPETKCDLFYLSLYVLMIFFVPFLTMMYCYVCIIRTVHRSFNRINIMPTSNNPVTSKSVQRPLDMSFKRRAFMTILLLFFALSICWLPFTVSYLIWTLREWKEAGAHAVIVLLSYGNAAAAPIIYACRIKKFRDSCKYVLPKRLQKCICQRQPLRESRRVNPGTLYKLNSSKQSAV